MVRHRPWDGSAEVMLQLGKPDKIYEYNGLNLRLFGASHLRRLIGRSGAALLTAEEKGHIPRSMFKSDRKRFYTEYELSAVLEMNLKHGFPYRFGGRTELKWESELKARWAEIRQCFVEGRWPEMPLMLQFNSEEDLRQYLRTVFRSAGIQGDTFIDKMTERFLERRILL